MRLHIKCRCNNETITWRISLVQLVARDNLRHDTATRTPLKILNLLGTLGKSAPQTQPTHHTPFDGGTRDNFDRTAPNTTRTKRNCQHVTCTPNSQPQHPLYLHRFRRQMQRTYKNTSASREKGQISSRKSYSRRDRINRSYWVIPTH
jgi:hypothetical protein